ncbi:MAG TPA: hypothetical protein VKR32_20540 [Puia sp.]|nr:hypothetical protein [Puia sp.]
MYKRIFYLSISSGIFAAFACIVYNKVYFFAFEIEFKKQVNPGSVIGINLLACIAAGAGYYLFKSLLRKYADRVFNIVFMCFTFASLVVPLAISLPLDVQNPELFPALAIPMHFFPFVGWFSLKPFFIRD